MAKPRPRGRPSRGGNSLLPREHGAYAEVLFPLLTALGTGRPTVSGLCIAAAVVGGFLVHEPLLVLLGRRGGRATEELGAAARTRAAWLAPLAFTLALLGWFWAPPPARLALAALLPIAASTVLLVGTNREKTLGGEGFVALAFSYCSVPVALACDLPLSAALISAGVWAGSFVLGTLTVHAILARTKRRSETVSRLALAAGISVILGVYTLLMRTALVWPLALLPAAFGSVALLLAGVTARKLRVVGWTLVSTNLLTFVALMLLLR